MTGDPTRLVRLEYRPDAWESTIADHPEVEVYHGAAWLDFLARSQGAEPVIAEVLEGDRRVGHFVGAIVRRYGIRILGSPLPGWTTQCMGLLLDEDSDRVAAHQAVIPFAFRDLGCSHVELSDRWLWRHQPVIPGFDREVGATFTLDLRPSHDELLSGMRRNARKEIRRAEREGLRAEVTSDPAFADQHYALLKAVFARQGLAPTYGIDRIRHLIDAVSPSGALRLVHVLTPEGELIATLISVGRGRTAIGIGAAFDRSDTRFDPMGLAFWETIQQWKAAGIAQFDFGGRGEYKAKYGTRREPSLLLRRARYPGLSTGRALVRRVVRTRQHLRGRLADRPISAEATVDEP